MRKIQYQKMMFHYNQRIGVRELGLPYICKDFRAKRSDEIVSFRFGKYLELFEHVYDECSEQSSLIFSLVPFLGFDELFILGGSFVLIIEKSAWEIEERCRRRRAEKGALKSFQSFPPLSLTEKAF